MASYLTITNSKELLRLPTDSIVYVDGSGDYSHIIMANGKNLVVTYQLGQIEEMLKEQLNQDGRHLVRIGKSLIINLNYLFMINPAKKQLILSDCKTIEFNLEASKEALAELKKYFESLIRLASSVIDQ